jgi:transposase-like protein
MAVPMSGPGDEKRFFVADTRRRFSIEEKLAIVAETEASPVTRVARKHGISSGLVFRWRKTLGNRGAAPQPMRTSEKSFVPLALPAPVAQEEVVDSCARAGVIEIILSGNRRIVVGKDFDAVALKRVIEALEAR